MGLPSRSLGIIPKNSTSLIYLFKEHTIRLKKFNFQEIFFCNTYYDFAYTKAKSEHT